METSAFVEAERQQHGLLAKIERRILLWLVARIPGWVKVDHLTLLGLTSLCLAGLGYYLSSRDSLFLHLVNGCLFINWLADSLDGTLARHRHQERPRYGFYVDHIIDAFGVLFLLGGLALSGYMTKEVALAVLAVYYLLCINIYLTTYTIGKFQISLWSFSPTELRLLLGIGNIVLLYRPEARILGATYLLFDVGGAVAVLLMFVVLVLSILRNTKQLYQLERLP